MKKKFSNKLTCLSANRMTEAFILLFSIFGIACYIMAYLTNGQSWSNLLCGTDIENESYTHFSDYFKTLMNAGTGNFEQSAERFSPFSLMLFAFFSHFMPQKLIHSISFADYLKILNNQTFVYFYLIIVMLCIVLMYRMTRSVLRRNELKMKNEIVAFLLVVSYPTMYCISMGNITGVTVALCLFFMEFYEHENKFIREGAIVAIAVSAAIAPYTFVFAFLILLNKSKMAKLNFAQALVIFLALFIIPSSYTGIENMLTYLKSLLLVSPGFAAGNGSIANILRLINAPDSVIYIVSGLLNVIAFACIFILPETWQKTTAATYCILNLLPNINSLTVIFAVIPLVYLLSEKKHKTIDWLYLLSFTMLITPIPEWFYSFSESFKAGIEKIGITGIHNTNELIAPLAVQAILILLICQAISVLKQKKQPKQQIEAEQTS